VKISPQIYWSRHADHFELVRNSPSGENFHLTDAAGINLNSQLRWVAGLTSVGAEIRNENIVSSNLGRDSIFDRPPYNLTDNRTNASAFVEHNILLGNLTVSLGLLANYNTAFEHDRHFYPSINAAYFINRKLKIFASRSSATRMPTFTDLYYKGATHKGNTDVQPEHSSSNEIGLKYSERAFSVSVNGFYMQGSNLIDWVKQNPDDKWESRNLTDIDKTGLELSMSTNISEILNRGRDVRLHIGYTFMNQTKDAGEWISNYVMDYLRHKFTARLSHPISNRLSADWQQRWQDREGSYTQYRDLKAAEEKPYDPFSLVDLRLNWNLHPTVIFLNINNLFDTYYFDLGNIPQPGIWISGGFKYEIL